MSGRAEFQAWLASAARQRRRAARWGALALALAACAGAFLLIATGDWLMTPSGWPLIVMVLLPVVMAAGVAAVAAVRASRLDSAARVAALADAERPDLQDRVKTGVDLLARPEPGTFDELVLLETARQISIVDLPVTLDEAGAARGRRMSIAAIAALGMALTAAWPAIRDGATTARVLMVPGALELTVTPGDARIPIGRSLTITAAASVLPRTPGRELPVLTIATAADAASGEMTPGDGAFSYVTAPVTESFSYRVSLGPATSREYRVEALPYPKVQAIDLSYSYPRWSGLEPREERDGGDVYGPEGTRVRMQVRVDKPVREAALVMGDGSRVPLDAAPGAPDGQVFETTMTLARDASYRVAVRDADGLANDESTEYFIRLMDDAPPDVRIVRPAGDQRVTPLAEVAVEARADDDHGVSGLELVYAVRGQDERVVPIAGGGGRSATGRHLIYLEDLGVSPGDFVSFYARARDIARGKQPTESRSDIFFLEVKPFEEEFAAAQSMAQAGAGAASRQLQSLAAAQKEIIVATWKLERRSTAGRSSADLKSVAEAQRELRQRTAQAAAELGAPAPSRRGRRGRGLPIPVPEPQAEPEPAAEDDPASLLTRAGEAMERASRELDARRPRPALDHENAALNELLRIEAQVRRREIMQAQNQGGGGGGGGGNQDLSALFDRELQRQQRTNYENRSNASAGGQEGEQESEALRRVREMAQRQEAMRREQEALARANVTPEERKRRLERLRREQEELRRQTEQLARQLQQQAGQSAQSAQAGEAGQSAQSGQQGESGQAGAAGAASAAAEAMSEAARSLGSDEPGRAGEQSARAGGALRDLERELGQRSARGQSQAMNDTRLEAQQLAEAQRRLADDAARASGEAGSDAGRRLASEKERMAERLDALGRRLEGDRQAANEARRLAREQREGAETWRSAGSEGSEGSEGSASSREMVASEAEMASALEGLARRLGAPPSGAGEADTRRLAEELDETRAARERLADLERRIQELRRQAEQNPGNQGNGELGELAREFGREAARGGGTPEQSGSLSRSAPGTEQWKQDFSKWESMRDGVIQAIEAREAAIAQRLAERLAAERVHGGYDARTPEAWRRLVAEYYQAIAARRIR